MRRDHKAKRWTREHILKTIKANREARRAKYAVAQDPYPAAELPQMIEPPPPQIQIPDPEPIPVPNQDNIPKAEHVGALMVQGDCVDVMRRMLAGHVDLIVTSPPYNIGKNYGTADDRRAVGDYRQWTRTWMTEAARVLDDRGSMWVVVGSMPDPAGGIIPIEYLIWEIGQSLGLHLIQTVTWQRHTGRPQTTKYTQVAERLMWWTKRPEGYVWTLDAAREPHKRYDKRNSPLGRNPSDVWTIPGLVHGAANRPAYPCPFPLPLVARIIKSCSHPGALVLDPFSGSGQTAIAATGLAEQPSGSRSIRTSTGWRSTEFAKWLPHVNHPSGQSEEKSTDNGVSVSAAPLPHRSGLRPTVSPVLA